MISFSFFIVAFSLKDPENLKVKSETRLRLAVCHKCKKNFGTRKCLCCHQQKYILAFTLFGRLATRQLEIVFFIVHTRGQQPCLLFCGRIEVQSFQIIAPKVTDNVEQLILFFTLKLSSSLKWLKFFCLSISERTKNMPGCFGIEIEIVILFAFQTFFLELSLSLIHPYSI